MFTDKTPQVLAEARQLLEERLDRMGAEAVAAVRQQMETGYDEPIRATGRLMADVRCERDGLTLRIGNTLPYAEAVHDGTPRRKGRPYLRDGVEGVMGRWMIDDR